MAVLMLAPTTVLISLTVILMEDSGKERVVLFVDLMKKEILIINVFQTA